MKTNRIPLTVLKSFLLLIFFLSLFSAAFAADPDAELGPGVAQKVNQQDAPLDHALTKDAAQQGVRQSGAGDPIGKTEPIKDQWFQSGKFPRDTYIFNVGTDGKIYGKGQNPPKGSTQKLAIRLTQYEDGWVSTAEMVHQEGDDFVTDGLANSGMGSGDRLASDQTSDAVATANRNADRLDKFKPKDPYTAVRQALVKLQMRGKLYDPSREIEETAKKEEEARKQAEEAKKKESEPRKEAEKKEEVKKEEPVRQAHPVHGENTPKPFTFHTYQLGTNYTSRFKIAESNPPLPAPSAFKVEYNYFERFNSVTGQTVIGTPPAASDPYSTYPSEPWWSLDNPSEGYPFRYSGDQWGDCLGPSCLQRGGFRPPIGRWTQFIPSRTETRNDLSGFVGFADTIPTLSARLGPVIELTDDKK